MSMTTSSDGRLRNAPVIALAVLLLSTGIAGCFKADTPPVDAPRVELPWLGHAALDLTRKTERIPSVHATIRIHPTDSWKAPDESGRMRDWSAWVSEEGPRRWFLLFEPGTACVRAAGQDSVLRGSSAEGEAVRTVSRFSKYLRDDPELWTAQLRDFGRGHLLAFYLSARLWINRPPTEVPLPPGIPEEEIRWDGDRAEAQIGAWTLRFDYSNASARPFAGNTSWVSETRPATLGWLNVSNIDLRRPDRSPECAESPPFNQPRVEPRRLGTGDWPTSHPLPAHLPMNDALDALYGSEEAQAFLDDHPDALVSQMLSQVTESTPRVVPIKVEEVAWFVTLTSPNGRFSAYKVDRSVYAGINDTRIDVQTVNSGTRVSPVPAQPAWMRERLVPFDEVVALAREAGLEPNQAGWSEPSELPHPTWRVAYYHPWYGVDPEAVRVEFSFDARTGWLDETGFNVEPSGFDYGS